MKKVLVLVSLVVLGFTTTAKAQVEEDNLPFDPAFVHVVYFWLNNPESSADRVEFKAALSAFLEVSKYANTNFIGTPPKASRSVVDDSFTYCLIVTFESAEAQEAYQNEQAHLDFIEKANHLWEKVVVYDAVQ